MPFDLSSAKPAGFDLSSATPFRPVDTTPTPNPASVGGTGILGNVSDFLNNANAAVGGAIYRAGNAYDQASNAVGQGVRSLLPQGANAALDRANTSLGLSTLDQSKQATNASIAEHAQLDKPLDATVGGKVGSGFGNALLLAPAALAGAGLVPTVAANALMSGLMTPGDATQRGMAGLFGGAGAAVGKGFGDLIGNYATNRLVAATAKGEASAGQNATRDVTLQMAKDNGLVLPPGMVNRTGVVPNLLEAVAGKASVAQNAMVKNQPILNAMARSDVGLAADTPISKETLQGVRDAAGGVYDAVKKFGTINTDQAYSTAIQGLNNSALSKDFPELANGQVSNLISALDKPTFTSESAVELLKKLRFDGSANKASLDPTSKALGKAQMDAATAVEGVLDRNLKAGGQDDLLKQFQDARTQIAKTYSLEKAINPETGNVIPNKLAAQAEKGKPLSGGLADIAAFGGAFKDIGREQTASTPMFSAFDSMGSTLLGLAGTYMHGPIAGMASAALPIARPLARGAALSPLTQRLYANPQYGPGLLGRQVPQIADNELMRALLQYGAASGSANSSQK